MAIFNSYFDINRSKSLFDAPRLYACCSRYRGGTDDHAAYHKAMTVDDWDESWVMVRPWDVATPTMWGPAESLRDIAKLVNITPISLCFVARKKGLDFMGWKKTTYNLGGHISSCNGWLTDGCSEVLVVGFQYVRSSCGRFSIMW